ncbi:hypothetical protein [Arsenicicoccus sp. oral taxon 190]|uniref:hypothetical protein n=1 Tax=Arsenicicoccus sp. oral taxon 190 TaxID=1658671 RepID=UPI00067A08A6|nr:hypothetical protein [Arsenicicoccus sp. oral taxon 190]AKT52394.1 hypothetical protein ADJ73_15975 [Arsenicicoccus sp. oral taxon 190]
MTVDESTDPTATDTGSVFEQAQDADAGQVSRSGLYPTLAGDEDPRTSGDEGGDGGGGGGDTDTDDPEVADAALEEDQEHGRGPTIEPGA